MKKHIEIFLKDIKLIKGDEISNPKITFGLEYSEYVAEKVREIIRGNPSQIIIKNSSNEKIETRDVLPSDSYQLAFRSLWTELKEIIIKNPCCQIISKNKSDQIIETRNLTSDYCNYKKEKLKWIQSKIIITINTGLTIKIFKLTVVIKCAFENKNERVFIYTNLHTYHTDSAYCDSVQEGNSTVDLGSSEEIIDLTETKDEQTLKIPTPKIVTIEYYISTITANVTHSDSRKLGVFTSKPLEEEEIQGFGTKILSEDITDLWNEN